MTKRSLFHFSHCTWRATNLACSSPSQACGHELIVHVMSWAASTKLVQGHARVTHKLSFYEPGGWADELLCTFATSKLILSTSSPPTSHSLKIVTSLVHLSLSISYIEKWPIVNPSILFLSLKPAVAAMVLGLFIPPLICLVEYFGWFLLVAYK